MPNVYLFDIDGTLITTGGAGRKALLRTFEVLFDRGDAFDEIHFGGMTDRAIVRAGLTSIGEEPSEGRIDEVLKGYVEVLHDEVRNATRYAPHPGITEALDALADTSHAIGLGTGNIQEGARIKLSRLQLYERFAFGGFGSDHEDRAELIRIGAERGAAHLNVHVSECRVVIVGDTPKDIAAAEAIGAESLAVATGSFTVEQLEAAGATHAYQSLAAPDALETLLG